MENGKLPRLFTIVSSPRSGSNYLCGLIGSHPMVGCHNEIFHHDEVGVYLPHLSNTDQIFSTAWRDANPREFIARMIIETTKCSPPEVTLVGSKLLLNQYQIDRGLGAILDTRAPIIFLSRNNKLAFYSSSRIAQQTGVWATQEKSICQHKITFNESDYWLDINSQEEFENLVLDKIAVRGLSYYKVEYERLFEKTMILEILDFLNIPIADLCPTTVKQNSSNLLERFNNPEDVKEFLESINRLSWIRDTSFA